MSTFYQKTRSWTSQNSKVNIQKREREYVKEKYGTGECNPFKAERSEAKFFLNTGGNRQTDR